MDKTNPMMTCPDCESKELGREFIDCHPYIAVVICEGCGVQYNEQGRIRDSSGVITYSWFKREKKIQYEADCGDCGEHFRFTNYYNRKHIIRDLNKLFCSKCYPEQRRLETERYNERIRLNPPPKRYGGVCYTTDEWSKE